MLVGKKIFELEIRHSLMDFVFVTLIVSLFWTRTLERIERHLSAFDKEDMLVSM